MKVDRNDINKFLQEQNPDNMRAFLNNCLLWHVDDKETILECVKRFSVTDGVFDKHDGEKIDRVTGEFTKDYLLDIKTNLTFNFSKERYLHALDVAYYLEMKESKNNRNMKVQNINSSNNIKETNLQKKKKINQKQTKKKNSSLIFNIVVIAGILLLLFVVMKLMQ